MHRRSHIRRGRGELGEPPSVHRLSEESGATAVEFALVLPVLTMLLLGIIDCGMLFNNYIALTNAAAAGSRQLIVSRGSATPYSSTVNAITLAAPSLTPASISRTLTVNGVTCTSDSATCQSAFGSGDVPAQVALAYPCQLIVLGAMIPSCTLHSSSTGLVQ